MAGTARMTRLVKSVYLDVCLYNWDKNAAVPEPELFLMLADLEGQGMPIINALVSAKRLHRNADGSVYSDRAMAEAALSFDLWQRKSLGGKKGGKSASKSPSNTPPIEPEPEPNEESLDSSSVIEKDGNSISDLKPVKTYDVDKIIAAWNAMAAGAELSTVRRASEERRAKTRAQLEEHDEAEVLEAISLIPARPFCLGENDKGWKATFDWLVRSNDNPITRILEGGMVYGADKHEERQARARRAAETPPKPVLMKVEPEMILIWTQQMIDEANANFRRVLGIETRFGLGEAGTCIKGTVKEFPDPSPEVIDTAG
jgi:hypothetical protein